MAYVRQKTWIEYGPRARRSRAGNAIYGGRIPTVGRRGCGDVLPSGGYDAWCNQASALNPVAWFYCMPHDLDVVFSGGSFASTASTPPPPPPPGVSLVAGPSGSAAPGAVFAGNDSSGNPVYAVPQTAQANAAAYAATLSQFFSTGSGGAGTDCSTFWNSTFNSSCGGSMWPLAIGGGLLALLVLLPRSRR